MAMMSAPAGVAAEAGQVVAEVLVEAVAALVPSSPAEASGFHLL